MEKTLILISIFCLVVLGLYMSCFGGQFYTAGTIHNSVYSGAAVPPIPLPGARVASPGKAVLPAWVFLLFLSSVTLGVMILTEIGGNIPALIAMPKKLISLIIAGLLCCLLFFINWIGLDYRHFLYWNLGTCAVGWWKGNALWRDFFNGDIWKGWLKKL